MPSTTPSVVLKPPFRWARKEDCYDIAELVRMSSAGVADYLWRTLGAAGADLLEIGEQRLAREDTDLSYKNCVVADMDGDVAGFLLSFVEDGALTDYERPASPAQDGPDVLAPYRTLVAPGSYHICEMALLPRYQSQGLGTRLFEIAKAMARACGCAEMSLLVFEQNVGALRLYERLGFKEVDRQPVVPHERIIYTGDVLLMTAPVALGAGGR